MEGTFQSSLSPKPWETLHMLHSLPGVKALARHGDPSLNTAGLRQKATLALLSCLGFPQASQCHTKGKAASVSVEGTANVSTRADTDRVLSHVSAQPAAQHIASYQHTLGEPCWLPCQQTPPQGEVPTGNAASSPSLPRTKPRENTVIKKHLLTRSSRVTTCKGQI